MNNRDIKILAIETSCDETSAAIIGVEKSTVSQKINFPIILSNIVSSQIDLHAKTGGVVPEVASRAHLEAMIPVIKEALAEANSKFKIQNLKSNLNSKIENSLPRRGSELAEEKIAPKGSLWEKLVIENLLQDVTHIAVTVGPGLIGSLLVGFNTAKSLAYALDVPIIPINHIEGHIYSALAQNKYQRSKSKDQNDGIGSSDLSMSKPSTYNLSPDTFPILALTVSGGHTSLTLMKDHGVYENVGSTLDDAAGEAFDKVAKLLDLGYPGGPVVSRYAKAYRDKMSKSLPYRQAGECLMDNKISNPKPANYPNGTPQSRGNLKPETLKFPRPLLDQDNFNFSFSGLKTSVLYAVQKLISENVKLTTDLKQHICYEFEEAVVDVLVSKTLKACEKFKPKAVILAGGVAANSRLREVLAKKLQDASYELVVPPFELCGDNAAMIGMAAYYHVIRNGIKSWNDIKVDSNLKL